MSKAEKPPVKATKAAKAAKTSSGKVTKTPVKAVKPAAAKKSPKTAKPTKPDETTTILAKVDVGFGNTLYIRGEAPGLAWDSGVPMTCLDDDTWSYTAKVKEDIVFKLLLNDENWCQGEDLVAKAGKTTEVVPSF